MHYNGFENPKLGAIRLLRSQGCCQESVTDQHQNQYQKISANELQNLLRYKQELQQKVAIQRAKLADIPCVLELSKQIQELQQIVEGLSKENRQMSKYIRINKQTNYTFSTQCDEQQEEREHQKLHAEYKMLMKQLEKVNTRNSDLVNKLVNT